MLHTGTYDLNHWISNCSNTISEKLLDEFGGQKKAFRKNEILFNEGSRALYYWQVAEGSIRMFNFIEDRQEFTQWIFGPGESFGEPPLFCDFDYPSGAIAVEEALFTALQGKVCFCC